MAAEIIPKAEVVINQDKLEAAFNCPACGETNIVYTFSQDFKSLRKEVNSINDVHCIHCARKFQRR